MNDDATIGERIAHLRRSQGLTQAQLAERAELSIDVVKKLEQNIRLSARGSTLSALARVLKARTSDLMGDASGAAARAEPDHRPLSLMRLRRVLTPARGYGGQPAAIHAPPALTDVTAQLQAIDRAYHRDDYATVLGALPSLITGARAAQRPPTRPTGWPLTPLSPVPTTSPGTCWPATGEDT
ncbi:helix-turn-helix domain-containing protein [Micromonospora sp. LOL_023]|uniref:helix-turn-helix domain-containing protein n=1 Tax=Micromonospora sp. LOL_023 TaxID=3345418 RepID=UPI003A8A3BB9